MILLLNPWKKTVAGDDPEVVPTFYYNAPSWNYNILFYRRKKHIIKIYEIKELLR